jgi:AraC-like DNA-binding protein
VDVFYTYAQLYPQFSTIFGDYWRQCVVIGNKSQGHNYNNEAVFSKRNQGDILYRMRKDKKEILEARISGLSFKEISNKFHISKSTLSTWFHDNTVSKQIEEGLRKENIEKSSKRLANLNKIRGNLLKWKYKEAEEVAQEILRREKNNPLFIFGHAAYWGEGDKMSKNGFRFSNADPNFVKIYIKFLFEICLIEKEKMRLYLMVYKDSDPEKVIDFWQKCLNIPRTHFAKPYILEGKHKSNKLPFGTCIVSVANSYLKKQMTTWLKRLPEVL